MIRAILAAAVLLLASCTKDDDFSGTLKNGLYLYQGAQYAVAIGTTYKDGWSFNTGCDPGYITITDLRTSEYVFTQKQNIQYNQQGDYNCWGYDNGLSVVCIPTAADRFTGRILTNTSGLDLPPEMYFSLVE